MCAFQDDSNCEQEAAWFVDLYSLPRDQVVKKPKINWPKTVIDKKRGLNYVQSICFIRNSTQFYLKQVRKCSIGRQETN